MSTLLIGWLSAALALVGSGLTLVWPVGGVVLANFACVGSAFATKRQNTPLVRLGFYVAVAGLAAALQLAFGLPHVTAAALAFGLTLHGNEMVMRRWKTHQYQALIGFLVGLLLLLLAGRAAGWSLLGVAPIGGLSGLIGLASAAEALAAARIVRGAQIHVGHRLPDFELPRREGGPPFRLSALRGQHVLLCFVRGDWCPVCHVLMRIIMREAPLLKEHGVRVVLITPSRGAMAPQLRDALGIGTEMLLDEGAQQAQAFGLIEGTRQGEQVPLPVALLVGPDGTLLDISRPDDVTAFTSESRIARVLRAGGRGVG